MTGRNDLCPCGSGKKYKICCLGKVMEFPFQKQNADAPIPGSIFNIDDPNLNQIKSDLQEFYHLEKKNAQFLFEICLQLGLLGYPKDGILYAKRALKFCSSNNRTLQNSLLTNLAAMHSEIGEHKTGLEYLVRVPKGFPRKTVIEANIRRFIDPFDKVRPLYEEAILEEPDFFLPYENIITRMPVSDDKREFLINSAFKKMPRNPIAALYWADKELQKRNYEILAADHWIEQVRSYEPDNSKESSIPLFLEKCPQYIGTLELIHEISKLMFLAINKSTADNWFKNTQKKNSSISSNSSIATLSKYVDTTESQFRCNVAKNLFDFAITYGEAELVRETYDKFCENCKKSVDLEQSVFSSLYRKLKVEFLGAGRIKETKTSREALKLGEEIALSDRDLTEDFVNSLFDLVDDLGKPDDVLNLAKNIFPESLKRVEFYNEFEEFRLNWNLGIISGKANLWALSEIFFKKTMAINAAANKIIENTDFSVSADETLVESINEQIDRQDVYIIIAKLGQKKINEAEIHLTEMRRRQNAFEKIKEFSEVEELIDWLKKNSKKKTFKNDFQNALKKFGFDYFIGEKPRFRKPFSSISDAVKRHDEASIRSQIELHETLEYHETVASEDLSEVYNSLEELIPNYRNLPENAQVSFISAETYRSQAKNHFDTAPSIMGYCKGLEIYIRKEIFEHFSNKMKSSNDYEDQIQQALSDPKVGQFRSLISFLKSGYLELGNATQCLKLCGGKTSERVVLLKELKHFIQQHQPTLLQKQSIDLIENLSKTYRNPAVHEANFSEEDLDKVRAEVANILNSCLSLRLIN